MAECAFGGAGGGPVQPFLSFLETHKDIGRPLPASTLPLAVDGEALSAFLFASTQPVHSFGEDYIALNAAVRGFADTFAAANIPIEVVLSSPTSPTSTAGVLDAVKHVREGTPPARLPPSPAFEYQLVASLRAAGVPVLRAVGSNKLYCASLVHQNVAQAVLSDDPDYALLPGCAWAVLPLASISLEPRASATGPTSRLTCRVVSSDHMATALEVRLATVQAAVMWLRDGQPASTTLADAVDAVADGTTPRTPFPITIGDPGAEWEPHFVPESATMYWHSSTTGDLTYHKPDACKTEAELAVGGAPATEHVGREGQLYYSVVATGESVWVPPPALTAWRAQVRKAVALPPLAPPGTLPKFTAGLGPSTLPHTIRTKAFQHPAGVDVVTASADSPPTSATASLSLRRALYAVAGATPVTEAYHMLADAGLRLVTPTTPVSAAPTPTPTSPWDVIAAAVNEPLEGVTLTPEVATLSAFPPSLRVGGLAVRHLAALEARRRHCPTPHTPPHPIVSAEQLDALLATVVLASVQAPPAVRPPGTSESARVVAERFLAVALTAFHVHDLTAGEPVATLAPIHVFPDHLFHTLVSGLKPARSHLFSTLSALGSPPARVALFLQTVGVLPQYQALRATALGPVATLLTSVLGAPAHPQPPPTPAPPSTGRSWTARLGGVVPTARATTTSTFLSPPPPATAAPPVPTEDLARTTSTLPIASHRQEVLDAVAGHRLVCIAGETGSGKSSQVPKYLYEASLGTGGDAATIVITQPRRVAAVTLAKRVAAEMGCRLGDLVGYRVGNDGASSNKTRILFVTTGWLLTYLTHNPDGLQHYTHVIVDEVHERDLDTDLLCLLLKGAVAVNTGTTATMGDTGGDDDGIFKDLNPGPNLKVVLMSATLSVGLFVDYFAAVADVTSLHVGAMRFPVRKVYLEDVLPAFPLPAGDTATLRTLLRDMAAVAGVAGEEPDRLALAPMTKRSVATLVANMVGTLARPGRAILVFVAGFDDINTVCAELEEVLPHRVYKGEEDLGEDVRVAPSVGELAGMVAAGAGMGGAPALVPMFGGPAAPPPPPSLQILPMHSSIDFADQMRVFQATPDNVTNVIVATNIAESSLTIDNVDTVIDTGLHKSIRMHPRMRIPWLSPAWVSRASAKQRLGRCGRTGPGMCYRLYSKAFHDDALTDHEPPEMLRSSLDTVVLRVKCMGFSKSAKAVLRHVLDPPEDAAVDHALMVLAANGALPFAEDTAPVTALGRKLAMFPNDLTLGRLVIMGIMMGVPADGLVLAAALAGTAIFTLPHPNIITDPSQFNDVVVSTTAARLEADAGTCSEPLAARNVWVAWRQVPSGRRPAWCATRGLSHKRLIQMQARVVDAGRRVASTFPDLKPAVEPLLKAGEGVPVELFSTRGDVLKVLLLSCLHSRMVTGKPSVTPRDRDTLIAMGLPPASSVAFLRPPRELKAKGAAQAVFRRLGDIKAVKSTPRGLGLEFDDEPPGAPLGLAPIATEVPPGSVVPFPPPKLHAVLRMVDRKSKGVSVARAAVVAANGGRALSDATTVVPGARGYQEAFARANSAAVPMGRPIVERSTTWNMLGVGALCKDSDLLAHAWVRGTVFAVAGTRTMFGRQIGFEGTTVVTTSPRAAALGALVFTHLAHVELGRVVVPQTPQEAAALERQRVAEAAKYSAMAYGYGDSDSEDDYGGGGGGLFGGMLGGMLGGRGRGGGGGGFWASRGAYSDDSYSDDSYSDYATDPDADEPLLRKPFTLEELTFGAVFTSVVVYGLADDHDAGCTTFNTALSMADIRAVNDLRQALSTAMAADDFGSDIADRIVGLMASPPPAEVGAPSVRPPVAVHVEEEDDSEAFLPALICVRGDTGDAIPEPVGVGVGVGLGGAGAGQ